MSVTAVPLTGVKRKSKKHSELSSTPAKVMKTGSQPVSNEISDGQPDVTEIVEFSSASSAEEFIAKLRNNTGRDVVKELIFLKSLPFTILQQKCQEKHVHRLKDLVVGTVITVRSYRIETGGKFGDYPVIKGDFGFEENAELALTARYMNKLNDRPLPFYMLYAGTCE